MFAVRWEELFVPSAPFLEIVIRGTVVYFTLFFLLRLIRKRQSGAVSATDLLVLVIIADASQNAMTGDYKSITDGMILAAVIICWSYVLDALGYAYPWIGKLVHPPPLPLVKNGVLLWHNMKREQLTKEELMTQLREQGIEELSRVKIAYMEGDGHVSVIEKSGQQHPKQDQVGI